MKLLAVGDIHLGRHPSRLPEELSRSASKLSPAAAWRRTVEFALEERTDAVLLAGDVIESEKDFFEGFRELKAGVDRLRAAGIRVIAVAGNHDVLVLPRLADLLEEDAGFKLLGRGGKWECVLIEADGEKASIWGWSFPQARVPGSPLAGANFEAGSGVKIGLLHCDRDQTGSPYAPVKSQELQSSKIDNWLLGHVHKPDELTAEALNGYLGCLSGMDPGESGPHGPWMLGIDKGRVHAVEQVPLAPLRWERLQVDVSELEDPGDIETLIVNNVRQLDEVLSRSAFTPLAVGLRVILIGQTSFAAELSDWAKSAAEDRSFFQAGARDYFIEHSDLAVLPSLDLESLAKRSDPLGLLAQRVVLLDRPSDDIERQALVRDATKGFQESLNHATWQVLESNALALAESEVVRRLRLAGLQAINKLWAQQSGSME